MSRYVSIKSLLVRSGCIAIVAPHPDDEVFGCGLLIAAARRAGLRVIVIVLTDGQASHPKSLKWPAKRLARLRQCETRRGLGRLGAGGAPLRFMGWRDGALELQGCHRRLRKVLADFGVTIALVSSPRDFHPDHQAAFTMVMRAAANEMLSVGTYEVWSRVDVGTSRSRNAGTMQKSWAATAHRSQMGSYITDDLTAFVLEPHALRALVNTPERYQLANGHHRRRVGQLRRAP